MRKIISVILCTIFFISALVFAAENPQKITALTYIENGKNLSIWDKENGKVSFNAEKVCVWFSHSATENLLEGAYLLYDSFGKWVKTSALFSLSPDNSRCVYISPVNGLKFDKKHKAVFPASDTFIEFDVGNVNFNAFFTNDFETVPNCFVYGNISAAISKKEEKNTLCITSANQSGFVDFTVNTGESDKYIVDVELMLESIGGEYINLFDGRQTSELWQPGIRFKNDGTFWFKDGEKIGTWEKGEWFKLSLLYDFAEGWLTLYKNDMLLKTRTIEKNIKPSLFRIDTTKNAEFYIDNMAIYEGNTIKSFDSLSAFNKVMDNPQTVETAIGDASVFSGYSQIFFKDGIRQKYSSTELMPVILNKTAYINCEFINRVLLAEGEICSGLISINGVKTPDSENILYDDTLYVSARKAAEILNLEYLFDERGFFIFAEEIFPHTNGEHFLNTNEISDMIYRYIQFENPYGEEVLGDYENSNLYGVHPRLLYTESDIEIIKENKNDPDFSEAISSALQSADNALREGFYTFTQSPADSSKQEQASNFQNAMSSLATAHLLCKGEDKYAEKAMEYINTLLSWESLSADKSNLIMGHWAMGMAIAYDSFYNYFSAFDEGRTILAKIEEKAEKFVFDDTIMAYHNSRGLKWVTINDNFQGVVGGGVMSLCMALADLENLKEKITFLFENIIKSHSLATSLYFPDGGYYESIGYSTYMLGNLTKSIEGMFECFGTDYGLGSVKGFSKAGDFIAKGQSVKNVINFHDNTGIENSLLPCWFAYRYGECDAAEINNTQLHLRGKKLSLQGVLYRKYYLDKKSADIAGYPLDSYFFGADAGTFRNSYTDKTPIFAGFHGGWTNIPHDMLDLGQFVFEADGVPWAVDLGSDDYMSGYFEEWGYNLYRKRPEGENCIVINPQNTLDESGNNYYGQSLGARAELIKYAFGKNEAFAAYDLTNAYKRDARKYIRGYFFGDNRTTFTIRDELSLNESSKVYWFMHTLAGVTIEKNDTNEYTLSYGDKKLKMQIYCNSEYEISIVSASAFNPTGKDKDNSAYKKIRIFADNAEGDFILSVKLIPESVKEFEELKNLQIKDYTIKDKGEISADVSFDESGKTAYFKVQSATEGNAANEKLHFIIADYKDEAICNIKVQSAPLWENGEILKTLSLSDFLVEGKAEAFVLDLKK